MKKDIARKQHKLQKSKKVAGIRRNSVHAAMPTASIESPAIDLMGKEQSLPCLKADITTVTRRESSLSLPARSNVAALPSTCLEEEVKCSNVGIGHQTECVDSEGIVVSQTMTLHCVDYANISAVTLRRSSRIPRESRVITSGDFLLGQNVRKRHASTEASEVNASTLKKYGYRAVFPGFPTTMKETRNDCTDFVLPDTEYAALKLQVCKTKQLLNRGRTDLTNSQTEMTPEVTIVRPTDESVQSFFQKKVTITTKRNEPIQLIHCGQLQTSQGAFLSVIITVQLFWISTWVRESNEDDENDLAWCLLKESKRDLKNCQKMNMHGVETKDVVASICIFANKDKKRLTFCINTCDSLRRVTLRQMTIDPGFHVMTGSLLSSCAVVDYGDSCDVTLANVWARTSRLKHVCFDSGLCKILTESTFEEVDDNLNSLLNIDGLQCAVLGASSSMLFIWNKSCGQVVKTIDVKEAKFNSRFCAFCKAEKGFLFLGLFNQQTTTNECSLVVVNASTSVWKTIAIFPQLCASSRPHRSRRRQTIIGGVADNIPNVTLQARMHGRFFVSIMGSATVYVWRVSTGKELVHLENGHFDAATVYQSSHQSEIRLLVSNRSGNVVIYSARGMLR